MYWELPPYVVFGFVIPRSVQQVIPIETIWSDGIFKIGRNKFARTYKFTDINYAVASKVDKSTSSNSMVQEKYVTVSCYKKTIEEARTYFDNTGRSFCMNFSSLIIHPAAIEGKKP